MQQMLTRVLDVAADLGVRALIFVVFVGVLFVAYRLMRSVLRRLIARAGAPLTAELAMEEGQAAVRIAERGRRLDTVAVFGLRLVRWVVYAAIGMVAMSTFTPGLWDALGGLGVGFGVAIGGAVGFGAQQLVRDYLNGVLILGENPYGVGDIVAIGGVKGTVEEVSLRRTVVRDVDGTVHSVPNGGILVASNYTRTFARVNERLVVAYGSDIDLAMRLINEIGTAMAADPAWAGQILEAPAVVRVDAIADPGIPILVQATVRPGEQWAVAGELRRRIVAAFVANRIELATARRLILDRRDAAPPEPGQAADDEAEFT